MDLSAEQIRALIQGLQECDDELQECNDCLLDLADFAEAELAGRNLCEALTKISGHMDECGECREEYEALRRALEALGEDC